MLTDFSLMWHGCTASESLRDMYLAPLLYYRNGLLQKQVVLIPYRKKINKKYTATVEPLNNEHECNKSLNMSND